QLEVEDDVRGQVMLTAQLLGQQGAEVVGLDAGDLGEDGWQLGLRVDGPALVGLAVEVDGQVGDHRDGLAEIDQATFHPTVEAEGDPPGDGQVAVEPGGQQGAAVDFHAQL